MTDSRNAPKALVWLENEALSGPSWDGLPGESRVWLYTADRVLAKAEIGGLVQALEAFIAGWAAHGQSLQASWRLEGGRCLMIALDESSPEATGCSIDTKVHWLQTIGKQMGVDWMSRSQVIHHKADANDEGSRWTESSLASFWAARKAGRVDGDTPVVNAVVMKKLDCMPGLVVPFERSWHEEMWR